MPSTPGISAELYRSSNRLSNKAETQQLTLISARLCDRESLSDSHSRNSRCISSYDRQSILIPSMFIFWVIVSYSPSGSDVCVIVWLPDANTGGSSYQPFSGHLDVCLIRWCLP